jgi:hypothetical protein
MGFSVLLIPDLYLHIFFFVIPNLYTLSSLRPPHSGKGLV